MISFIIGFIAAIIGIVSFHSGNLSVTLGCGIVIFIINAIELSAGTTNPFTMIAASVIGIIITRRILLGIATGLCYEAAIMSITGLIALPFMHRRR